MDMVDNIRTVLGMNGNLTKEFKENIFELVILFNEKFPNVDLTNLKNRLSTLKVEKLNKFLNNDVSMYDNRTNTLFINASRLDKGYDAKHVLMFELLNMISSTNSQMGFNVDDKYEALNVGYTEILANYLVGNEGEVSMYPDEAIETNLISVMIGADTLEKAYFNNDADVLVKGFEKAGLEI